MKIKSYAKKEIALRQLETALELYFQGRDLFSVVTLAGAAEEILGQLSPEKKRDARPFRSVLEILRPGRRKEEATSTSAAVEDDGSIHMDLEREALFLLGRGIHEYRGVAGSVTEAMARFEREAGPRDNSD